MWRRSGDELGMNQVPESLDASRFSADAGGLALHAQMLCQFPCGRVLGQQPINRIDTIVPRTIVPLQHFRHFIPERGIVRRHVSMPLAVRQLVNALAGRRENAHSQFHHAAHWRQCQYDWQAIPTALQLRLMATHCMGLLMLSIWRLTAIGSSMPMYTTLLMPRPVTFTLPNPKTLPQKP